MVYFGLAVVASLLIGSIWYMYSGGNESPVIEVKRTPRAEIGELTLNEFRELALDCIQQQGYDINFDNGDYWAEGKNGSYFVKFDPAGEHIDPRSMNQLKVSQKKREVESVMLVTSIELPDQSESLAQRMGFEVFGPRRLIQFRREHDSGD
ncbi:MAG: hypothetical protein ABEJ65_05075 [bacterium]